jgi:hypothetical protein
MIISHRHRFIFIKTAKTAGTSIEIALSRFLGPEDVLTPTAATDDRMRRESGGRFPQNYRRSRDQTLFDRARILLYGVPKARFHKHMGAAEIRALLPDVVWNSYFKFCVERNPWDRAVSLYHWRRKAAQGQSLSEFIASGALQDLRRLGRDLYTIDGEIVVDRIIRFEDLETELEEVRRKIGLPVPLELPRAKGGTRTDRRPYSEIMTPEDRRRIAKMFQEEIRFMGYHEERRGCSDPALP